MTNTKIQWTDATWNPTRGCSMAKGSETGGCLNCYAARLAARNLPDLKSPTTGEPFARIMDSGPRWTGKVELIESALTIPLRWKKHRRIFVNSMSDLFHESLTDEQIDRVFAIMALCPQHTFQVLTKRPERALRWFTQETSPYFYPCTRIEGIARNIASIRGMDQSIVLSDWPLPNVWLGVSVENQATADERIPLLLRTPAAKRFASYEPALGPVDFDNIPISGSGLTEYDPAITINALSRASIFAPKIDWLIVGGESGPGARTFDIQWARNAIAQCKAAGVACFVKQLGSAPFGISDRISHRGNTSKKPDGFYRYLTDRKGGDMSEWPIDMRVREFPA